MKRSRGLAPLAALGLLLLTTGCADPAVAESKPEQESAASETRAEQAVDPDAEALLAELVPGYLPIMDSLADDSLEKAVSAAENFENTLIALETSSPQAPNLVLAAAGIRQAADLTAARGEFAELSKAMIEIWRDSGEKSGTVLAHCSMAEESWLQTDAPLSNPYYGSEMLRCGEVVER